MPGIKETVSPLRHVKRKFGAILVKGGPLRWPGGTQRTTLPTRPKKGMVLFINESIFPIEKIGKDSKKDLPFSRRKEIRNCECA